MPYKAQYNTTIQPSKESSVVETTRRFICLSIMLFEVLLGTSQICALEFKNQNIENLRICAMTFSSFFVCLALQGLFPKTIISFLSKATFICLILALPLILYCAALSANLPATSHLSPGPHRIVEIRPESFVFEPPLPGTHDPDETIKMTKIESKESFGLFMWRTKRRVVETDLGPNIKLMPDGRVQVILAGYGKPLICDLDEFIDTSRSRELSKKTERQKHPSDHNHLLQAKHSC